MVYEELHVTGFALIIFVTIGNSSSKERTVTCGVPQGSVLGPLLFLLYIKDFNQASSVLDLHLFADDSNLFFFTQKFTGTINNEWLCSNNLSLNIYKQD